jgi:hypothetical protein
MSLVNELTLLNNINIKNVKESREFSQQTNQENDYYLLNKYSFNLYSRNLLKNNFFSKYLLTPSCNNIGNIENKNIFKKVSSKESPLFLNLFNDKNNEKSIKKNNLSLTILNYNNNQKKKYLQKNFPMTNIEEKNT